MSSHDKARGAAVQSPPNRLSCRYSHLLCPDMGTMLESENVPASPVQRYDIPVEGRRSISEPVRLRDHDYSLLKPSDSVWVVNGRSEVAMISS